MALPVNVFVPLALGRTGQADLAIGNLIAEYLKPAAVGKNAHAALRDLVSLNCAGGRDVDGILRETAQGIVLNRHLRTARDVNSRAAAARRLPWSGELPPIKSVAWADPVEAEMAVPVPEIVFPEIVSPPDQPERQIP